MSGKNPLLDQFEVGGNLFELIEFSLVRNIGGGKKYTGTYGVNVAKVREVVHLPTINPLASSTKGVAGVFELRGVPIPAVNLAEILGDIDPTISSEQQIIVTEFSQKRAGFIVNSTHRIRRVSWDKVLPPSSDDSSCMTGMILMDNKEFLFILDLEKILSNIENNSLGENAPISMAMMQQPMMQQPMMQQPMMQQPMMQQPMMQQGASAPQPMLSSDSPGILIVDDSNLILNNLHQNLLLQGYRVLKAENGRQALDEVRKIQQGGNSSFGSLNMIITDIEMPQMDGLTLVKTLREDPSLGGLPIILHSSLDGRTTQDAAISVGANGYVVKNDINQVLEQVKSYMQSHPFKLGA